LASARKEVVVTGVDIPFFAMVWLILKWSLASIPAMFILSVLSAALFVTVGGAITALLTALGVAASNTP
jgi:hypothetical protein